MSADETCQSIADLKDAITAVGKELLDPLNLIRDGIVKMAGLDTDADKAKEKAAQEGTSDVDIYGSEENAKAWNWGGRGKPGPFSMSDDEKAAIDKAIMREIAAESPECVERITDRLMGLNAEYGMRMTDVRP